MHDHIMDTSEAPKPAISEGVNGTHVITTTLESSVPNPKIVNVVTPTSLSHAPSHIPNHVIPVPPASTLSTSPSVRPLTFSPQIPVTQIQVPRSSHNLTQIPVINNVFSSMEYVVQKPTLVLTQNSIIPSENHVVNHISSLPNNVSQAITISSAPPPILSQPNAIIPNHVQTQSQISIQGPATASPFGQPSQTLSVITPVIGTSVIQTFSNPPGQTPTTSGVVGQQQQFPIVRPPIIATEINSALRLLQPNAAITLTPIHHSPEASQNASKKKESEDPSGNQEDSSDTDMEIKSLDLTSRVNIIDREKVEKDRERPMSWEGELSDSEIETNRSQEEQMRVEAPDEPMSPMSPVSPCSDNDQEPLPTQIKSEDALDNHSAFTPQTLPQTDSPVPARSDSGCELHVGPFTPTQSPLLPRIHPHTHSPTHLYSPTQSPSQSRHLSGFSSPYSHSPSTGLSRNNSDASQYGGSYNSYSSAPSPISPIHYSPSQSPNLGRVIGSYPGGGSNHGVLYGGPLDLREPHGHVNAQEGSKDVKEDERLTADLAQHSVLAAQSGITRQQLINSPCPICGDKISGFHYGIFSCESCKGFFKRTVQNKKNYVCMRGSSCPVTIATRKKCPACRFDRCLRKGMKLEAIREDRTRGGRSTYQCAPYTLPPALVSPSSSGVSLDQARISDGASVKSEPHEGEDVKPSSSREKPPVPILLQQICDVEHLWHCSEAEMSQIRQADAMAREMMESEGDCVSMCKIAEGRLYKIVKWCKSLPLFRHISIDDQIILLMNSWCELLLLSCCFRSMDSPGEIRVSSGRTMSLAQAEAMGIGPCIERMLNLSYQLRRLQVDNYEYMAMKVIVLLTSDVAGLKEGEKVRYSQEKVVQALQEYTLFKFPHLPSKFGELLLRIPELQRTCHASKEMLSVKKKEGDVPSFNFLFELLRGDH